MPVVLSEVSTTQITVGFNDDNVKCLIFRDDAKSKTNQGGLTHAFMQPKVVQIYAHPNTAHCPIRLYEKYIGLLPETKKYDALYMHPKVHCVPNCWYIDRPMGIVQITPTFKRLCKIIGKTDKKYVNQSLRATNATRMTDEHIDTQMIKDFTGHRSNAVEGYKHINDNVHHHASSVIQGHAPKNVTATISNAPDDSEIGIESENATPNKKLPSPVKGLPI